MLQGVKTTLGRIPAPALVLGILGWLGAIVFFLFWIFEVGRGPFNSQRFGTAGEWASGLATAAAVTLSLYVLLRERHERQKELRLRRERAEFEKLFGDYPTESALRKEAERLVPVLGRWRRLDTPTDGTTSDVGCYAIDFELFNGLDRPLNDLTASMFLTGDWSPADYETKAYPGGARICEHVIVPPGQAFRFEMESDSAFELPAERVEKGGYITATWRIGEHDYQWSYHGNDETTYLFVRSRSETSQQAERE